MNKTDSYLDKTKYYLAQLETDFDVRLQRVQGEVEALKVTLWLAVMAVKREPSAWVSTPLQNRHH